MGRKKSSGGVVIANDAKFARNYHDREGLTRVHVRPGLNEIPGEVAERLAKGDPRFAKQIDEGRAGALRSERADAITRMIEQAQEGSIGLAEIPQTQDQLRVVASTHDKKTLIRFYKECERVSVRAKIVEKLRTLGVREV